MIWISLIIRRFCTTIRSELRLYRSGSTRYKSVMRWILTGCWSPLDRPTPLRFGGVSRRFRRPGQNPSSVRYIWPVRSSLVLHTGYPLGCEMQDAHWQDLIAIKDKDSYSLPAISDTERKRREVVWELFTSECVFLIDHLMVLKHVRVIFRPSRGSQTRKGHSSTISWFLNTRGSFFDHLVVLKHGRVIIRSSHGS